jgi:hypothetical protein
MAASWMSFQPLWEFFEKKPKAPRTLRRYSTQGQKS